MNCDRGAIDELPTAACARTARLQSFLLMSSNQEKCAR